MQKDSDVEEATTATTATEDPSIRIAHDPAFETNYKDESFFLMMAERAGWLVGLLLFQSVSSFVLEENENLLQSYPVIVKFLTMLVGAGYVRELCWTCVVRVFLMLRFVCSRQR
jgi:Mg/Co/Ni transporter MgtE